MKILVLLNQIDDLKPGQTTAMLTGASVGRNHETWLGDFSSLAWASSDGATCSCARATSSDASELVSQLHEQVSMSSLRKMKLEYFDLVLLRINPARVSYTPDHVELGLDILQCYEAGGGWVINGPSALRRTARKSYLGSLPKDLVPKTLLSNSVKALESFRHSLSSAMIVKPLVGTRGEGVFRFDLHGSPNLRQTLDLLLKQGPVIAQEFVGDIGSGDTRIVVCNGQVLEVGGQVLAVRRLPQSGDFRSNIHQGGRATAAIPSQDVLARAKRLAQKLKEDGIWLAGLDFVGVKVIEVNVWATGGFRDAERYYGVSFSESVIEGLETHFRQRKAVAS